jgi:AAHS family 4-hydroxybenzoate transporter-like MFS transporter
MTYEDSSASATLGRAPESAGPAARTETTQRTLNVQDFINSHPISGYQILIVFACFVSICLDGFDAQALGFIVPAIRAEWKLGPAQIAPLFSMGLIGLMIGSFIFGPLADKYGRKLIIMVSVFSFGVFSLATAYAHNIDQMLILRLLTGIGLGGAMPNLVTITSEFCPQRKRAFLTTLMFCGFTVGGAGGGVLAANMVVHWGWRSVFVLGGIAPVVLVPILYFCLPESIRYLVVNNKSEERIARSLSWVAEPGNVDGCKFVMQEQKLSGFPVSELFAKGLASGTICLWIAFFVNIMVVYFFTLWLPTIIHNLGMSLTRASVISSVYLFGGTAGGLCAGALMDRFNPYKVLVTSMFVGGIAIFLVGQTSILWFTVICILISGMGTSGSQIGLNALTAAFYPTVNRATGVSWGLGVGRCGSVVGAMLGGYLLAWKWALPKVYLTFAVPMIVAALAILGASLTARAKTAGQEWKMAAAAAAGMKKS